MIIKLHRVLYFLLFISILACSPSGRRAPPGYVSEAVCLRLISGQQYTIDDLYNSAEELDCKCRSRDIHHASFTGRVPATTSTAKNKAALNKAVVRPAAGSKASLNVKKIPASSTSTSQESAAAQIKRVQKALNNKGAKLLVDGVMGSRTVRLLKAFQTMNDLPITGRPDQATLEALGVE